MLSDYLILLFPYIWVLPATLFVIGVYLLARNRKPKYNRRMAKYY